MVKIENVTICFGPKKILSEINYQFASHQITVIVGKSGTGKTTLLQSIIGLIPITQGTITLDQTEITHFSPRVRSEKIGYLFQQYNLFPHMTVLANCMDPLLVHNITKNEAKNRVRKLLLHFDMLDIQEKYPIQLSGGQQQRVAIIRALALQPLILLLDEPTASLDSQNTIILVTMLKELVANGMTIITSSQDGFFTKQIANQLLLLDHGKILAASSLSEAQTNAIFTPFLV